MATWAKYLAFGVPVEPRIYHMCDKEDFHTQTKDGAMYFPPTFKDDGFVHATGMTGIISLER